MSYLDVICAPVGGFCRYTTVAASSLRKSSHHDVSRLNEASWCGAVQQLWLGELVRYIQNKSLSWTWWSWDPTSADTGGLLADDVQTLRGDKYAYIQNLTYPGFSIRNATSSLPTGIRTSGL